MKRDSRLEACLRAINGRLGPSILDTPIMIAASCKSCQKIFKVSLPAFPLSKEVQEYNIFCFVEQVNSIEDALKIRYLGKLSDRLRERSQYCRYPLMNLINDKDKKALFSMLEHKVSERKRAQDLQQEGPAPKISLPDNLREIPKNQSEAFLNYQSKESLSKIVSLINCPLCKKSKMEYERDSVN